MRDPQKSIVAFEQAVQTLYEIFMRDCEESIHKHVQPAQEELESFRKDLAKVTKEMETLKALARELAEILKG